MLLAVSSRCGAEIEQGSPEFRGLAGTGTAVSAAPATWTDADIAWRVPIAGRGWSSPAVGLADERDQQVWLTTASEDGRTLTGLSLDLATGRSMWEEDLFTVSHPREKHLFNSYASPTPCLSATHAYLSWGSNGLAAIDRRTFEPTWVRRDLPTNHYRGPGSSPVLDRAAGRLFVIYDGFDFQFVECFDAATGETLWRSHRPWNFGTDNGDHKKAYATPLLIDASTEDGTSRGELICPTSKGVFALDPATGRELWRVRWEQFSTASRPVFVGGRLYITTGFGKGAIVCVRPGGRGDVTESHVVWAEPRTMPSKPSPIVAGGRVYGLNDRGVLITLDANTGERLAQTRLSGNFSASPLLLRRPTNAAETDETSAGPTPDDRLFVVDEEGQATALRIGGATPEVVGTSRLPEGVLATPIAVGDRLLVRTRTELVCVTRDIAGTD